MLAATDITTTKVEQSKLNDFSMENLPFGKYFTDHMLEADYEKSFQFATSVSTVRM